MKDFRQLKVWQKAHELVLALYPITVSFPRAENYGLTAQIRRAAASIPSNLAEGCGRGGDAELARFCCIARGSASELEYHLLLSRDLKLIQPDDYGKRGQALKIQNTNGLVDKIKSSTDPVSFTLLIRAKFRCVRRS